MKVLKKILFPPAQGAGKKGTAAMLGMVMLGLLFTSKVKAQEWFPVGAKWTYSVFYPSDHYTKHGIGHMECTKDTIIEGITAKVLTHGSMCDLSYEENIFYYNDTMDILYYYVEDTFRPYFDFSKKAGEVYYIYFPNYYNSHPLDSILIIVDSVVIKPFAGINVRHQYIRGGNFHYSTSMQIIEYMGHLGSFYHISATCDFDYISELRCYSDNTFSYFSKPIYKEQGCDVNLSINEVLNEEIFAIYPNPIRDKLKIENRELKIKQIKLYNITGSLLQSINVDSNELEINMRNLQSGVYFVKITTEKGMIIKKIVKL